MILGPSVDCMPPPREPMTVYISIDPTAGIRSELAIASMYMDTSRRFVVSLFTRVTAAGGAAGARRSGFACGC